MTVHWPATKGGSNIDNNGNHDMWEDIKVKKNA
jgi:hypothetical protein